MKQSLIAQTLHYFARPHRDVRRTLIGGPAAWRGAELAGRTGWRVELTRSQVDETERAIGLARATGGLPARSGAGTFRCPR